MSDLKPCPFCGGPVNLEEANPTYDRLYGNRRWWGVVCRNTINLGGSCAIQQRPSASKEAAIERWNRRAQPAQAGQVLSDSALLAMWTGEVLSYAHAIEQAVLAKRVPMTREEVKELARKVGYDNATAQERADFINGIRHAEVWHGIVGEKGDA